LNVEIFFTAGARFFIRDILSLFAKCLDFFFCHSFSVCFCFCFCFVSRLEIVVDLTEVHF